VHRVIRKLGTDDREVKTSGEEKLLFPMAYAQEWRKAKGCIKKKIDPKHVC